MMMKLQTVIRLSIFTWPSSRKSQNLTLHCRVQQIWTFGLSTINGNEATTPRDKLKLWKRVKKNDPAIKDILKSPDAQHCVSQLAALMNCDETVSRELIARNSNIVASHTAQEKIKLLIAHGYSAEDIVATPSILHRTCTFLKSRLEAVEAVPYIGPVTLHAIKQPDEVFRSFIQRRKEGWKVMDGYTSHEQFLSNLFQCDEKTITELTTARKLLLSLPPGVLSIKVNILLKYQVSHKFIREHPRILIHTSVMELQRRLSLLHEEQLLSPDTNLKLGYMLSCQCEEFSKSLSHLVKQREALEGCKDKLEYLCFRLQCNKFAAQHFLNSPSIQRLSEVKLKQTLDFLLLEAKVSADFVLNHKMLFTYSVKRQRERWNVICNIGYKDISILPLAVTLPDKKFSTKFSSHVFVDTFNQPEE